MYNKCDEGLQECVTLTQDYYVPPSDYFKFLNCPLEKTKCSSNMNLTVRNTKERNYLGTLPIYASTICSWGLTAVDINQSQAILIRIEEISNGEVYFAVNLSESLKYDNLTRVNPYSKVYLLQFGINDQISVLFKPISYTSLAYFRISYWRDKIIPIKQLATLQKPEGVVLENDDWLKTVPKILQNYKLYINKQSQRVYWIVVYYAIGLISFMSCITLLGILYRFIYLPHLHERVNRLLFINGRFILCRKFVKPSCIQKKGD